MIISEAQIMQIMVLLSVSLKLSTNVNFNKQVGDLLSNIANQQNEDLKEVGNAAHP